MLHVARVLNTPLVFGHSDAHRSSLVIYMCSCLQNLLSISLDTFEVRLLLEPSYLAIQLKEYVLVFLMLNFSDSQRPAVSLHNTSYEKKVTRRSLTCVSMKDI